MSFQRRLQARVQLDVLLPIYDGNLVTHLDSGPLGAALCILTAVVPPLLVAPIMSCF